MPQIGVVSDITQQRLPDLIASDRSQSTESAAATVGELSRQAYAIDAGLDRLVREQQDDYAAAASAANRAADVNLWLLVGIMVATAAAACATVAALLLPVLRPLASLQASVRAIASGDLGTRARAYGPEEVASLARDFNQMVDERQRADETLRESEERLRLVVSNAPIILFVVDRDGIFTLSEGNGLEALGLRPGEVVGLSIFDMFADIPDMEEKLNRALAGEAFTNITEVTGLTFETHCAPLRDHDGQVSGLIGVAIDISERQRAEEALRESEEKFRRIFENVQDIYYRTDAQGIIADISPSVQGFGYTHEELIGRQVLDIYENPEECSALLRCLLDREWSSDYEVHLKAGDGRREPPLSALMSFAAPTAHLPV